LDAVCIVVLRVPAMRVSTHHENVAGEHQDQKDSEGGAGAEAEYRKDEYQADRDQTTEDVEDSVFHGNLGVCCSSFCLIENNSAICTKHYPQIALFSFP
jgi:hypothetical protein